MPRIDELIHSKTGATDSAVVFEKRHTWAMNNISEEALWMTQAGQAHDYKNDLIRSPDLRMRVWC